jgi:hypothetical protein
VVNTTAAKCDVIGNRFLFFPSVEKLLDKPRRQALEGLVD